MTIDAQPEDIRFNRPQLTGQELHYIQEAVLSGHTSAAGPFTSLVSALLREELGSNDVILTTSCTDALEMTAMLLELKPGDTVVVPSYTFVSTALAFAREGARIAFCDIEPVTLGIDPDHLAQLLGADPTIRAVVVVHYAGIPCRLDEILSVLASHPHVALIEDNAHGLFASLRDRPLGSIGRFGTLSFHETKNFTCGEGGALVLNTHSDIERAYLLRDKGTNRRSFALGHVDKYTWKDTGSSFGLSDMLAAFLYAQLEQRDQVLRERSRVFRTYATLLEPAAAECGLILPTVPTDCEPAYHMFYVLCASRAERDQALNHLNRNGIGATFHYVPLHTSEGGRLFGKTGSACPVSENVSGRLLRLPFFNALAEPQIKRIVSELLLSLH